MVVLVLDWNPTIPVIAYGSDDEYDLECLLEPKPPWRNISWQPIKWLVIGITIGYSLCRNMK